MLIETHAHLQSRRFARDLDRVLARAADAGIGTIVCASDRLESSRRAVRLARESTRRVPRLKTTVGVHPHHAAGVDAAALDELEDLARDDSVCAVGEIGLDAHYPDHDLDRQLKAFTAQAHLAGRLDRPVVIHCREAYDLLIETIRRDPAIPRRGIVHCFAGDLNQARALRAMGYRLGLTGALTYPNASALRAVVKAVGLDAWVVETDAPYLAPQARRGHRNEPSYLKYLLPTLAELTGVGWLDAACATSHNARAALGWPDEPPASPSSPARLRHLQMKIGERPTRELAGALLNRYDRVTIDDDPALGDDEAMAFVRVCRDVVPEVVWAVRAAPGLDVEARRRFAEDTLRVRFQLLPPLE